MLKVIPGISKKIMVIMAVILFAVSMVLFISPSKIYADSGWTWMNNGTPYQTSAVTWDVAVYAQAENYNGYKYEIFLTAAPYPVPPALAPVIADKVAGTQEFTGVINSSSWGDSFTFYGIAAGDYIVNFIIRNSSNVEVTRYLSGGNPVSFSCWDHTQWIDVDTANKVITWNFTNSAGRSGQFWLYDSTRGEYPYNFVINPLVGDSTSITYSLLPGDYWAGMNINGNFSYQWFSIAAPASAPAAAPRPLTPEEQASLNLSIEQQANLYGKGNIGFTKMLYDNILGRAADSEGLNNWVTALTEGKITLSSVVYNFVFSKELEGKISGATPEEFITFLYENVLGRNPDPQGLASWVDNMKNGMSKEEVLLHFLDSDEFKSICEMFGLKP
ncbi:MAG: DUF4214 domain-containing protein [Candidatus Humimicrobiaceae bacterium]